MSKEWNPEETQKEYEKRIKREKDLKTKLEKERNMERNHPNQ